MAICEGNSPVTGELSTRRPVTRSFDVFFVRSWINGWVNNGEAGDLRCHRAQHDVIVMICGALFIDADGVKSLHNSCKYAYLIRQNTMHIIMHNA